MIFKILTELTLVIGLAFLLTEVSFIPEELIAEIKKARGVQSHIGQQKNTLLKL